MKGTRHQQRIARVAVFALLATLVCCNGSHTPAQDENLKEKPRIEVLAGDRDVEELAVTDLVVGKGQTARAGDTVVVRYVGVLVDSGEEFDSSWDRGTEFDFVLGEGKVIDGWEEGIVGMHVGGRRRLTVPADLAYASEGFGSNVPPESDLVFVVDLVDIRSPGETTTRP